MNRRRQVGGPVSLLFCALLLAACSAMSSKTVNGWPSLKIVEHYVTTKEMRDKCAQYVGFFDSPMACAEFYFDKRECHIYYSSEWPQQEYIRAHEWKHCEGFEHDGEDEMKKILERSRK